MNRQAFKTMYDLAVGEGYTKSEYEFQVLLNTNQEALDIMYKLAVSEGYTKSLDEYKSLLGIGESFKKKEPTVSKSSVGVSQSQTNNAQVESPVLQKQEIYTPSADVESQLFHEQKPVEAPAVFAENLHKKPYEETPNYPIQNSINIYKDEIRSRQADIIKDVLGRDVKGADDYDIVRQIFEDTPRSDKNYKKAEEYLNLEYSKNTLDEADKTLNASDKKQGILSSFFHGAKDQATSKSFLSATYDLRKNFRLLNVANKIQNGEELTDAENALLNATAVQTASELARSGDISNAYIGGQGSISSLKFAAELAITGGIGKAAVAGTEKALIKVVSEKVAEVLANKAVKTGVINVAKAAAKTGVKVATRSTAAGLSAAVAPSTFANMEKKKAGTVTHEIQDGRVYASGVIDRKQPLEAYLSAAGDQWIEHATEMSGGSIGVMGKFLKEVPAVGKILGKIASADTKGVIRILSSNPALKKLNISGFGGEYNEEFDGALLRQIFQGESMKESFFNMDAQAQLVYSLGPMSAFSAGMNGLSNARINQKYNKSNKDFTELMFDEGFSQEEIYEIKHTLLNMPADRAGQYVSSLVGSMSDGIQDGALNESHVSNILSYMVNARRVNAYNSGKEASEKDSEEFAKTIENIVGVANINKPTAIAIAKLEREAKSLESNDTQVAKDRVREIHTAIQDLQKNQLPDNTPTYQLNGRYMDKDEFIESIGRLSEDDINDAQILVTHDEETAGVVKDKYEQLKPTENAVQEQETGEGVLRTEQPEVGLQEMEQGDKVAEQATEEKEVEQLSIELGIDIDAAKTQLDDLEKIADELSLDEAKVETPEELPPPPADMMIQGESYTTQDTEQPAENVQEVNIPNIKNTKQETSEEKPVAPTLSKQQQSAYDEYKRHLSDLDVYEIDIENANEQIEIEKSNLPETINEIKAAKKKYIDDHKGKKKTDDYQDDIESFDADIEKAKEDLQDTIDDYKQQIADSKADRRDTNKEMAKLEKAHQWIKEHHENILKSQENERQKVSTGIEQETGSGNNGVSSVLETNTVESSPARGINIRNVSGTKRIRGLNVGVKSEITIDDKINEALKKVFPLFKGSSKVYEITDGNAFRQLQLKGLKDSPWASSVTLKTSEEYNNSRMFVYEDGSAGLIITKDGEIASAWSDGSFKKPFNISALLVLGIKMGGTHIECFHTILPDYYMQFGFKMISRTAFNDEYRPSKANGAIDDWNYDAYKKFNEGRPDVVFGIYEGGDINTIEDRLVNRAEGEHLYYPEDVQSFDNESYDQAQDAMFDALDKYTKSQQETKVAEKPKPVDKKSVFEKAKAKAAEKKGVKTAEETKAEANVISNTVIEKSSAALEEERKAGIAERQANIAKQKTAYGGEMNSTIAHEMNKLKQELDAYNKDMNAKIKIVKQAEEAVKVLSQIAPDVNIVVHETSADYESAEEGRNQDESGEYNVRTKTIHINLDRANSRTVAHEMFHALLLNKGISDAQAQAITSKMMDAVKKVASKKLLQELNEFSSKYRNGLQSEESIAELFGMLASEEAKLQPKVIGIVKRWINKLASIFGLKPFAETEIIDVIENLAQKMAKGETITDNDISVMQSDIAQAVSPENVRKQLSETKIVDSNGQPLVMYQGRSKKGLSSLFNNGEGWFSTSRRVAVQFADMEKHLELYDTPELYNTIKNEDLKGQVYEAFLDIKNPMYVDLKKTMWNRDKERAFIKEAKESGNDGLVITQNGIIRDAVVFDESQIVNSISARKQLAKGKSNIDLFVEAARKKGFDDKAISLVLKRRGMADVKIVEDLSKQAPEVNAEFEANNQRLLEAVIKISESGTKKGKSKADILKAVEKKLFADEYYQNADDNTRKALEANMRASLDEYMRRSTSHGRLIGAFGQNKELTVQKKKSVVSVILKQGRSVLDELSKEIKGMSTKGTITTSQMNAIIKAMSKINTSSEASVEKFVDFMSSIFADVEYANKLKDAASLKTKIKSRSKNEKIDAHVRKEAKMFTLINEADVQNIDEYLDYANRLYNSIVGSKVVKGGLVQAEQIDLNKLNKYTRAELERQNIDPDTVEEDAEAKARFEELLGEDIDNLSYDDIMTLLHGEIDNEIRSELNSKITSGVKNAIHTAINSIRQTVKDMIETDKNQLTGEDIKIDLNAKDRIEYLLSIPLDDLSKEDLLRVLDSLISFSVNQKVGGVGKFIGLMEGRRTAKLTSSLRSYSRGITARFWNKMIGSVHMLYESAFKSQAKSLKFLNLSWLSEFISNAAKAERISKNSTNEYNLAFKGKKPHGKHFYDIHNIIERGVIAFMSRSINMDEDAFTKEEIKEAQKAEFERRRKHIVDSIERLKNSGILLDKKKADVYQEVYDNLVDKAETSGDIMSKADDINIQAVEWWVNKWKSIYKGLSRVSEDIYNEVLDEDYFYTPDRQTLITGTESESIDDIGQSAYVGQFKKVYDKKTGTLKKNQKLKELGANRYIDLSFDTNNVYSFKRALMDMYTAESIQKIKGFMSSKEYREIFGKASMKELSDQRIIHIIKLKRGVGESMSRDTAKINRELSKAFALGTGRALASLGAPLKQVIAPASNTMVVAGMNNLFDAVRLYFTNRDVVNMIKNADMAIAIRGLDSATTASFDSAMEKHASNIVGLTVNGIVDMNQSMLKMFVGHPDQWIARVSFLAYYLKALKKDKVDTNNIDWSSHVMDTDASNYAQQQVDRQQNVSDSDLQGELFSSKKWSHQIVRRVFFPFATFAMNQKSRMYNDITNLVSLTNSLQDKGSAAKSLVALGAEATVFNALRLFISKMTMDLALSVLGGMIGDDDDKRYRKNLMSSARNMIQDVLSPAPVLDPFVVAGANKILEALGEEDYVMYNSLKRDIIESAGSAGVTIGEVIKAFDAIDAGINGTFEAEYFGKKSTKRLNPNDKEKVKYAGIVMMMHATGIVPLPAEAYRASDIIVRYAKKRAR